MGDPYQTRYWDRVAERKRFGHPLDRAFLDARVARDTRVLDVGCGYGRSLAELREFGYTELVGVDTSAAMLARGEREFPGLDLRLVEGGRLPFDDGTFGLVLLFAVLTSIPSRARQAELLDEVERVLAPGGHVLISDLLLQGDARNRDRYARWSDHGYFETDDGGRFRHHDVAWSRELEARWDAPVVRRLDVATMNGNPVECFQLAGTKRATGGGSPAVRG